MWSTAPVTIPALGGPVCDHVFIDAERIHPCQPASPCDPPGSLYRVPGDAKLMGQGRDRSVETLQRISRRRRRPGGQLRSRPCQWVRLRERGPRAVRVRAADTLGPEQPHGPPETGNVVESDLAASGADRNDTAVRVLTPTEIGPKTPTENGATDNYGR